jgi:hypothetical protein
MTPQEIETAARRMLNVVGDRFWSSEEIIANYLYFAAMEMAQECFCIENRYTTTSVANQQEYAVVSRALAIKRIEYDGLKIRPITLSQLDSIDLRRTTVVTGQPQYYYWFDESIGFHPIPAVSDLTIKIFTFDQPPVLTTSSTTTDIPAQFHHHLVIGTAYYMSLKELGHPHVERLRFKWNDPGNRNSCIMQVKKAMKLRNKDHLHVVQREDDQPSTPLGMI